MATVIVFGATGNVGSVAAIEAEKRGASVVLALRDPNKAIKGLSKEAEEKGNFRRVKADLTQPDSVLEAVKTTGATRAFIYANFGSPDAMKATLVALKDGGVSFVVLLSSSTIQTAAVDVPPAQKVAFVHARVEVKLAEVFGPGHYVALRPGRLVTNVLRDKQGLLDGNVRLFAGSYRTDNIAPEDIGTVAGSVLADGSKDGDEVVYLYGAKWMTMEEAILTTGRVLGRDFRIVPLNREEGIKDFVQSGVPAHMGEFFADVFTAPRDPEFERTDLHEASHANMLKYAGRPHITLEEWVERNKDLFLAQ